MKKPAEICPHCGQKIKAPKPSKPKAETTLLMELYVAEFTNASWNEEKKEPIISFPRDMKAFKDLLAVREYTYLADLIPKYFQSQDQFLIKMGYDVSRFVNFVKSQDVGGGHGLEKPGGGGNGRLFTEQKQAYNRAKYKSVLQGVHSSPALPAGRTLREGLDSRRTGSVDSRIIEVSCNEAEDIGNIPRPPELKAV
jgi:hypothetical protein